MWLQTKLGGILCWYQVWASWSQVEGGRGPANHSFGDSAHVWAPPWAGCFKEMMELNRQAKEGNQVHTSISSRPWQWLYGCVLLPGGLCNKGGGYSAAGSAGETIKKQGSGHRDSVISKGLNTRECKGQFINLICHLKYLILKKKGKERAAYSRVLWACLDPDLSVLDSAGDSRSTWGPGFVTRGHGAIWTLGSLIRKMTRITCKLP